METLLLATASATTGGAATWKTPFSLKTQKTVEAVASSRNTG